MLMTAIGLALVAAIVQALVGIPEPWNKIVLVGIVVLFVIGLIQVFAPGAFYGHV